MNHSRRGLSRLTFAIGLSIGALLLNPAAAEEATEDGDQELSLEIADTDLEELSDSKYMVAKDSEGRVFLLDVESRWVFEFSSGGDKRGQFVLPMVPESLPDQRVAAFDVSPDGRWIAISVDREVSFFRDERHVRTVDLDDPPAIVMSLAFVDSSPSVMVSRMFFVPATMTPSLAESSETLVTIDRRGKLTPFALPIDFETDPVPLASLKQTCNLQLDEEGPIWAADKAKFRIRRFGSSGSTKVEIEDQDIESGIQEKEFDPESVAIGDDLTGSGSKPLGWSGSMQVAIRSFDVADDYLWIIANSDDPGGQRLDLIDVNTGEVHRIALDRDLPIFATIAVTERLIVFGTANKKGKPMAFDRYNLDIALIEIESSKHELSRTAFSDEDSDMNGGETARSQEPGGKKLPNQL